MSKSDLVHSMMGGEKISLFNAPTLVVDPNYVATTPVNEKQRVFFTRQKSLDSSLPEMPYASAAFWDGNKLDARQFYKADDVASVFLENDVCFVNVESDSPDFKTAEIMNSLKAQKFTLTVRKQPVFESTKNKMISSLTIYIKPIAVSNGYITSMTCKIRNKGTNPETNYTVAKLAKVFQANAKFYSAGTAQFATSEEPKNTGDFQQPKVVTGIQTPSLPGPGPARDATREKQIPFRKR